MAQFSYWKVLTRRKNLSTTNINQDSKFSRVMNTFDLTALGIGATLGVGVYVLAGHVSRDQAGPSVVLSFAIAAITSLLAGLCYAEFGARVPRAGSAFIYSYVCIGEFVAFVVGWNLILEYIIGSASVAKGISLYLDTLINDTLKNTFMEITPIGWGFLGMYFDLFAFGIAFSFGICLAFGIQTSKIINNFLTVLNLIIVAIVVIAGAFKADIRNWQIDPSTVNATANQNLGTGGFFPFGFEGTIRGAATCFFGFVGFDCIATTGEEVKDPQRAIPKSILFTLLIIFLAYFSVATVLTLMWPYYLQDVNAPLPFVFQEIGWPALKWIVTIGGMIGLIASLFGAMFPLPRIIYAMSQDGLVFKSLGKISAKFKTPVTGTICAALLTGLMSGLFDLTQLVNMLSIGTLLAYTVVAISITILRFMDNLSETEQNTYETIYDNTQQQINENQPKITQESILKQIINFKRLVVPNDLSTRIVATVLSFYCLFCFAFSLMIMYVPNEIFGLKPWAVGIVGIIFIILILLLLIISIQPQEKVHIGFRVPFVPVIPGISIFVNIYLMLQLDIYTWIRFGIWMILGLIIYIACICMYKRHRIKDNHTKATKPISNGRIGNIDSFNDTENKNTYYEVPIEQNTTTNFLENEAINIIVENNGILNSSVTKQSLDEIIPESELSDNHKEMKNPNGKTFFIESITYQENDKKDNNEEDAKSAIAVLDDVLKSEESISIIHTMNDFNRKTSVDSAMIPSFIEASTIAMVHKSHESLREEENENFVDENISPSTDLKNTEDEQRDYIVLNYRTEKEIFALNKYEEDEEDIPNISKLFEEVLEKDIEKKPQFENFESSCDLIISSPNDDSFEKENIQQQNLTDDSNQINDTNLELEDGMNTMDPMHSERFKKKLSQLISRPPEFSLRLNKSTQSENKNSQNSSQENFDTQTLKSIKSESNIQNILFEDISQNESKLPSSDNVSSSPDIGELLHQKMFHDNTINDSTDKSETVIPSSDLFRTKLEAVLKRGPSYRITKGRSIPVFPTFTNENEKRQSINSSSTSNHDSNKNQNSNELDEHKRNFSNVLQSLQNKKRPIQGKLFDPSNQITIQDALKRLKPVAQMTSSVH